MSNPAPFVASLKNAHHYATLAENALAERIARDKADAERQLNVVAEAVEEAAAKGLFEVGFRDRLNNYAIQRLSELGFKVLDGSFGGEPGADPYIYFDISWVG